MREQKHELKKTPLYGLHKAIGAKMISFAEWEMPLEYSGITEEHLAVRNALALFDISHLGKIEIYGPSALGSIQSLTTNDVSRLSDGQVQYNLMCDNSGGILDDFTLYRFNESMFMFCINAVNKGKILSWLGKNIGGFAEIRDKSNNLATLAIQGPLSKQVLQKICDMELSGIKYYRFSLCRLNNVKAIISRTGYTGEDGFEIYVPSEAAENIWRKLMDAGKAEGIRPAGLGARDSLRLETGYPLYGNDISKDTTPLEAGLERFVKFHKPSFMGKDALQRQAKEGIKKKLTGFEMIGRRIPRTNYHIHAEGRRVGEVTSGGHSPSLGKAIGMGYVETQFSSPGQKIEIEIREKMVEATVVQRPFYKTRNFGHK